MITWVEPYDAEKERADMLRLSLIQSLVLGCFQGAMLGMVFAITNYFVQATSKYSLFVFIGIVVAISCSWLHYRRIVTQQEITIDELKGSIEVIGDQSPHCLTIEDLRGYSINENKK